MRFICTHYHSSTLVRDREGDDIGEVFVYNLLPVKKSCRWGFDKPKADNNSYIIFINSMSDILNNLCSWEDEKPISIEWLLGKKDKNE